MNENMFDFDLGADVTDPDHSWVQHFGIAMFSVISTDLIDNLLLFSSITKNISFGVSKLH